MTMSMCINLQRFTLAQLVAITKELLCTTW